MNRKKFASVILIGFFLCVLVAVPAANAVNISILDQWAPNSWTFIKANSGDETATYASGVAQSWTSDYTAAVINASFNLAKHGSPTGTLSARLYYSSGEYGTSDNTVGGMIAGSATMSVADLTTVSAWYNFTFAYPYTVTLNEHYYISIESVSSGFMDVNNYVMVGWASTGGHDGKSSNFLLSGIPPTQGWVIGNGDLGFKIYGDRDYEPYGTPAPTPTPVPATTPYYPVTDSDSITQIANYLIALIIILIPAFLLGRVARMGSWGYLIGLAIGAGLGYVMLPATVPLWMFFAIVIGIVGFLMKGSLPIGNSAGDKD